MNERATAPQQKTPGLLLTPVRNRVLQRKCACGQHTVAGGECAECRKKRLQRKASNHTTGHETVPPIVHEVLHSPGQPLDAETRTFMEPRFGHDFSQVRVHTDAKAAESARAVNALAYTVGRNMVFGMGHYTPQTIAGRRLLAHELAHVAQQSATVPAGSLRVSPSDDGWEREADKLTTAVVEGQHPAGEMTKTGPAVQRQTRASPLALAIPPLRRFADIYAEYQQHRLFGRDAEAAALIPDLIAHMSLEEARQHAVELAFWLMDRGDWSQARSVLSTLEDAWWIQYVTTGIPVNFLAMPDTPRRLFERARGEAIAGRHEQATHLLGMAYLFIQFILHDASQQRETRLETLSQQISGRGAGAAEVAPYLSAMGRMSSYSQLGSIYNLLRDILGLYPRLQREAIAAGNQELARRYSGLSLLVRMELRERYTLSSAQALTMESAATTTPFGEAGYTIYGRDLSTTETVTPLPGTRTPAELGAFPSYSATTESLFESIAGQEEYLTELFTYPEIRAEFRSTLPDMSRLSDRLRVWRTMYRVYQRERMFPLGALMSLIRSYLERFTFHSEYNIRDYGVSYLSSDFPVDLAGRAVRDCGVYALMTAYEVYHTARGASPRLSLDFRLYAMPEHVILAIFDRDEGNFYLVNNNQIIGPRRGDVIAEVARVYSQVFGRRFGVAAGVEVNLGSTDIGDDAFRRQIWQRYRVGVATGLRPERPPGADPHMTEGEATHLTYQHYYEDLARFDVGVQRLAQRLDELHQTTATLVAEEARTRLGQRLPELTTLGRALTMIFAQRGPQADIILDERRARAALGRGFARRAPEIIGEHHIYLFTEASRHPLARLAMALLRFEQLGGTLPAEAQSLIQALRLIREFDADISAYDRAGRPAMF